jgi:drug/metabolite transporter (DMT)-like permease
VFAPGTLALLPFVLGRLIRLRRTDAAFLVTGLFSGGAWVLYSNSLLYTEVARALLLFYLTPLWSTLLARAFLGEPITLPRLLTIAMGIGGLLVILGFEGGFPLPRNAGDWLGLGSGMIWAGASVRFRRDGPIPVRDAVFAYFLGGTLLSLAAASFVASPPGAAAVGAALPALIAISVGFILPSMALIIFGSQRLSPGRVGILLMTEAVVGILSAAVLTAEPFGAREAIGAALIISAGLIDILWANPTPPAGRKKLDATEPAP